MCDRPEPVDDWVAVCPRLNIFWSGLRLETQLQSELNDSRVAIGVGDCAKGRIAEVGVGILKQRMIENVEELGAELEVRAIPDLVDREIFEQGEVEVKLAGTAENANARVAEAGSDAIVADDRRSCEAVLVDVIAQLGGDRATVDVLSRSAGSHELGAVRRSSIDAGLVTVCDCKVMPSLVYRHTLNGPTSKSLLSESTVPMRLGKLIGIIDHQPLRTDKVVRAVS